MVGDRAVDLDPPVHRAGVHDQGIGPGALEALQRQAIAQVELAPRRDEAALHPLGLKPQHHHHVRAVQRRVEIGEGLDEKPIRWREKVWISWHADDGFMLEKYSAQDENLIQLPPEEVGETTEGNQILARLAPAGGAPEPRAAAR